MKYNHFELKNIAFDEEKFPMLSQSCFVAVFQFNIRNSLNKRRIRTAALIRGAALVNFFCPKCGAYSRAALIPGRCLIE